MNITPTKAQLKKLPKLYATEGQAAHEKIAVVKFFGGRGTWYGVEFDGEDTFFGFVVSPLGPDCDEWGYFSLSELKAIRFPPFGLGMERDLHWTPGPVPGIEAPVEVGEGVSHETREMVECLDALAICLRNFGEDATKRLMRGVEALNAALDEVGCGPEETADVEKALLASNLGPTLASVCNPRTTEGMADLLEAIAAKLAGDEVTAAITHESSDGSTVEGARGPYCGCQSCRHTYGSIEGAQFGLYADKGGAA